MISGMKDAVLHFAGEISLPKSNPHRSSTPGLGPALTVEYASSTPSTAATVADKANAAVLLLAA